MGALLVFVINILSHFLYENPMRIFHNPDVFLAGQNGEVQVQQEHQGLPACQVSHSNVCYCGWRSGVGSFTGGCYVHLSALLGSNDSVRSALISS